MFVCVCVCLCVCVCVCNDRCVCTLIDVCAHERERSVCLNRQTGGSSEVRV